MGAGEATPQDREWVHFAPHMKQRVISAKPVVVVAMLAFVACQGPSEHETRLQPGTSDYELRGNPSAGDG